MSFLNILEAQTYAVQRVIERRTQENALTLAQTQDEKNTIKNQIRSNQWQLDQANKYIVLNGKVALVYSLEMFTVENLVKTKWDNEKDVPGTQQYEVNQLSPQSVEVVQQTNDQILADLNTLIIETDSLLTQSQEKLQKARELPLDSQERLTLVKESKDAIIKLSNSLKTLKLQRDNIVGVVLPSSEETASNGVFSDSIRTALRNALIAKPGYTEQTGDIDAAISMRRKALDGYYTAKTDLEKAQALERLNRTYAALQPDVPLTRNLLDDEDLFLTKKVADIATYNEILAPKTERLNAAQLAYANARDSGIQADIDSTKLEYDAANADYEVTLHEIVKLYDGLLGYQNTFGDTSMFPGSVQSNSRVNVPTTDLGLDANGNPKSYPLIWDTEDKKFVSQADAKADPGRYLVTTYTNRPVTDISTDAEKMQSILSTKYKEAAVAEADYQYKKDTEQLFFQNENRASIIADTQKDLNKLDQEWSVKSVSGKVTDDDFLKYQQQRQELQNSINDNQKLISDNSHAIDAAREKRDAMASPFSVLQQTQEQAKTYVDGTNRTVQSVAANDTASSQAYSKNYYDAKAESLIAQKQLLSATTLTDSAKEAAILEAMTTKGLSREDASNTANWSATSKAKYDDLLSKQTSAQSNLESKKVVEASAAKTAQAAIDKIQNDTKLSEADKKKMLENIGVNPADLQKSLATPQDIKNNEVEEKGRLYEQISKSREVAVEKAVKNVNNAAKELQSAQNELTALQNKQNPTDADKARIAELEKQIPKLQKNLDSAQADYKEADSANTDESIQNAVDKAYAREQNLQASMSNTGFEGINNSAPFYMQFPTLNSITDFKLRNGVDPYGEKSTEEIARDAIIFKIFETIPGVANAEEVSLASGAKYIKNVPQKTNINTVGSFTIYPSHSDGRGDWLSQTHKHTWVGGEQDAVAQLFQGAADLVSTGESLLKVANAGLNYAKTGSLKGNEFTGNVYNRKLDVLDYYKDSESTPINISFSLFTRNNFLNDVFRPIMFLTALGYPKRSLSGDFGKLLDTDIGKASDLLKSKFPDSNFAQTVSGLLDKARGTGESVENIERMFAEYGGLGPYRYFISKRPEYLTIRHASGLFYYPVAYIESFSYTFKGPWYNFDGQPLQTTKDLDALITTRINEIAPAPDKSFKEKVNETFTNLARNVKETFRPPPKAVPRPSEPESRFKSQVANGLLALSDSDMKFIRSKGLPFAYPSWAECNITIKNATPFFRDDFMAMFYESQKGGEELVTLTQQLTNQETFATGGRKSKDSLADDAYRKKVK